MRFIEKTDCMLFVSNGTVNNLSTHKSIFLLTVPQILLLTFPVAAKWFQF